MEKQGQRTGKQISEPTDFIIDQAGPSGLFGVFEDDGETGYLYLYEPEGAGVVKHLQIYNSSMALGVKPEDVQVVWSSDGQKCGVVIWNGFRGIIDLTRNEEGRVKLTSRQSPPINDPKWLEGFDTP